MNKLEYKKMSLFSAPTGSYLAHACNCQGVWGSGIAAEFAKRFPISLAEYRDYCNLPYREILGTTFITSENIICLHTSKGYAKSLDRPYEIIVNTVTALKDLLPELDNRAYRSPTTIHPFTIYSNKFNSGLFNVPWEQTEYALKRVIDSNPLIEKWVVCDYANIV